MTTWTDVDGGASFNTECQGANDSGEVDDTYRYIRFAEEVNAKYIKVIPMAYQVGIAMRVALLKSKNLKDCGMVLNVMLAENYTSSQGTC